MTKWRFLKSYSFWQSVLNVSGFNYLNPRQIIKQFNRHRRHRRLRPVHMAAARGKVDVARQGIIFEMFTFDMFNLTRFNRQLSFLIFKIACWIETLIVKLLDLPINCSFSHSIRLTSNHRQAVSELANASHNWRLGTVSSIWCVAARVGYKLPISSSPGVPLFLSIQEDCDKWPYGACFGANRTLNNCINSRVIDYYSILIRSNTDKTAAVSL